MKAEKIDLTELKVKEVQLESLVASSNKKDLSKCIRLLSMYIAIYKQFHGELLPDSYEKLLTSQEIDKDSAMIFQNGMLEAINMLDMIMQERQEQDHYRIAGVTIN